jgi:protein TonB
MTSPSLLGSSPPLPEQPPIRLGRALSLSLGTHVAGALVLAMFASGRSNVAVITVTEPRDIPNIVWIPHSGPAEDGSGNKGGGNKNRAPARTAQARGAGDVAAPVKAAAIPESSPDPLESDASRIVAPIQPAQSGLQDILGLLRSVAIGEPSSRGPGNDSGVGSAPTGPGVGSKDADGIGDGSRGGGVTPPEVVRQVRPQYTADAMRAKIQGMVTLEAVVLPDGSVGDVRIVRSLDSLFGLDTAAVRAVKEWRFTPGRRRGAPIPVLVTIELTFTLR